MSGLERYIKIDLRAVWVMVAALSLALPIFIPSSPGGGFLVNVIGTATATMFILSFPSSLFALPVLLLAQVFLGYDANTIGGMYVNLWLLLRSGSFSGSGSCRDFYVVSRTSKLSKFRGSGRADIDRSQS